MSRTKARIADIDTKIGFKAADEEGRAHLRSMMSRLAELSTHLQSQLNDADWSTKREIIGRPPSTNVDEHPSIGADYGDIVPSVKSPWKAMLSQTITR